MQALDRSLKTKDRPVSNTHFKDSIVPDILNFGAVVVALDD